MQIKYKRGDLLVSGKGARQVFFIVGRIVITSNVFYGCSNDLGRNHFENDCRLVKYEIVED